MKANNTHLRQATLGFLEETDLIKHVDLVVGLNNSTSKKTLAQKNAGKFYTPETIARPLVQQAIAAALLKSKIIRIIDPFCGDGRLLVWMLQELKVTNARYEISLWDYDDEAVKKAADWVRKESKKINLEITIDAKRTDTFSEFFKGAERKFDLVITNPPWEMLKPDPKELSEIPTDEGRKNYMRGLKEFSDRLTRDFPISRPAKTYGGWGVNLARVGTELSVRLAKEGGVVAVVTPAAIFADQSSHELRHWLFRENSLRHLNIYPAELKLFASVDQPCVSFVLKRETDQEVLHISHFQTLESPIGTKVSDLKNLLETTGHVLPVSITADTEHFKILASLKKFNSLSEIDSLWIGRELDETNYRSWTSTSGNHRFIKGRDINRFKIDAELPVYVKDSAVKIPDSVNFYRIAWRDISRPNQKRRVIATLLEPGNVAGNSLGVLHLKNERLDRQLLALLGIFSSCVFEFQLRAYLATGHVSAGVLKKVKVPELKTKFIDKISKIVERRLAGEIEAEIEMEVEIAKSYGLKKQELAHILTTFPKVSLDERNTLLTNANW